jgi:hypothetical protein
MAQTELAMMLVACTVCVDARVRRYTLSIARRIASRTERRARERGAQAGV